jgi:hypothetical protein
MTNQMTRETMNKKVADAFQVYEPQAGDGITQMFVRWISGGFVSSQGRFIITSISNCKMTGKHSYDHENFTCKVMALSGENFDVVCSGKYTWKMRGNKYTGEFSNMEIVKG